MILVAAFEPFAGRRRNRAQDAVRLLEGRRVAGLPIEIATVPTAYAELPDTIAHLLARAPAVLILVGEASSARRLRIERVAVNVAHTRHRDNSGACPVDEEVIPGAVVARRVAFDPRIACNAALSAGVPCEVSSHAGTFCCNAAFFHALGQAAALERAPPVAFVHVPARFPWARERRVARGLCAIAAALLRTV